MTNLEQSKNLASEITKALLSKDYIRINTIITELNSKLDIDLMMVALLNIPTHIVEVQESRCLLFETLFGSIVTYNFSEEEKEWIERLR